MSTNILINSRSMNGIITISDGSATLENGDLNCDDIISATLTTNQINATVLTVTGEIRCNLNGPLTIPTNISSLTGLLISYGNVSNSGATDFTNFGSTYTSTQQGFRFFNKSNTQTLTNLAIIDNTQTYFKSQLTGCTAETPLNSTSVVNKTYVDSNFVDRTNNLTQDINGAKTFTNSDLTVFNAGSPSLFLRTSLTGNGYSFIRFTGVNLSMNNQNPSASIFFQINTSTRVTINSTQLLLSSTTFLTTNDMKSRAPADPHSLLSDITTGTLTISSATATNTINGATQLNQQTTFNNFTPFSSVATPTAINHLTRKDYVDNNFVDRTNNLSQGINGIKTFSENVVCSVATPTAVNHLTRKDYVDNNFVDRTNNLAQNINGIKTFSENVVCSVATPTAVNHLTRKDYVDNNFVDRTNNLTQNVNGLKTFTNNTNFTATLLARTNIKLSEYENTPSSNNVTLTFPMPETIALRTTAATNNPMTVTLPTLSNNERGYVFTFNKLFSPTYGNFNVTFQTSGGQWIFTLLNQAGTPTTNTTLLSIDKIQCKLAVGFFGTTNYWIEQTDFSTYDRYKLTEWQNPTDTNSLTLAFPLPPTIALRAITASTMTITLPTLTTNDRGKIFTFVKLNTFKFDVTFNTSGGQWIFPLNNITGTPTTNITIFPSTKASTRLAVGWSGAFTYWIEVSDYSTFDRDENNLIYPRLAIANTFTNTNIFNAQVTFNNNTPISSIATPTANNHLTRKDYVDNNFVDKINSQTGIAGDKTFTGRLTNTFVIFAKDLSWLDVGGSGGRIQSYISATDLGFISVNINNNRYLFNTKDGAGSPSIPLIINSASTTISNNLISNNITAPILIGGTNNIYTNLDTSTGGANINIGARNNNINVKCNFNINESGYGTGQNTLIWMEGNNSRFENQNSTGGTYIFTIVESGTFNPLVINKTSVDIAGDAIVNGNLILYDTTPSTLSMSVGVLGNNMTFDPENTEDTTYNFKVNDITGTSTTTPLIISTASTTVANELISNAQATFNSAVDINGTMTFYDTTNFSTINQSIKTLKIENPVTSGFIILRTRGSSGLVQNTFKNYSALRNLALGYASFPWILFLDADERIPEPLMQEIISTVNEEKANDAYFFSESLCSIALLWNLADGKPTKTSDYLKKKRRAI